MEVDLRDTLGILPQELLEIIGSFLPATDIISLSYVNKRFNAIFKNIKLDPQHFLNYPYKYFECDVNSDPKSQDVKDIIKEINNQDVNIAEGYHKLQRVHLQNWVDAQPQSVEIIKVLEPKHISHIEEMVHFGEHWVFFGVLKKYIHVWNITKTPVCLINVRVGAHFGLRLLSNGNVAVREYVPGLRTNVIAVYEFKNQPYSLTLQHRFVFDKTLKFFEGRGPPLDCRPGTFHAIMKDVYIGSVCNNFAFQKYAFHMWNLSSGEKLCTVVLSGEPSLQLFVDFVKLKTKKDIIDSGFDKCKLEFFRGQYPNLFVVFTYLYRDISRKICQVNIFDVEKKIFTDFIAQYENCVSSCYIFSDKVCVEELINSGRSNPLFLSRLSIYSLKNHPVSLELPIYREPITSITFIPSSNPTNSPSSVFYKDSKVLVIYENQLTIFNLESDCIFPRKVEVAPSFAVLGFIEPKIVLMYNILNETTETEVRVYNTISGQWLFSFRKVNLIGTIFINYYKRLQFPSKVLVNFNDEENVFLMNF